MNSALYLATVLTYAVAFGGESNGVNREQNPAVVDRAQIVEKVHAEPTLDTELAAAIQHIDKVDVKDRPFIKFFTTYSAPPSLREDVALILSFWVHSLTGPTKDGSGNMGYYAPLAFREGEGKEAKFAPIQKVDGSDTLYWIDIRDYNWTEQSFEKVSTSEPKVRKPWVSEDLYDALRLESGNALIDAAWFIANTSDVTYQVDNGNNDPFYYILLYSQVDIPKTGEEFRKVWGIDVARAELLRLAVGVIVDKGESTVSRHARELTGLRSEFGYYWETSDFKTNLNEKDPLENLSIERNEKGVPLHRGLARDADAHEHIASTQLNLQAYLLTNDKLERVEFADPTLVLDRADRSIGTKMLDMRVRTARSCIICHPAGINIPSDALRDFMEDGVNLVIGTKEYKQAVEKFYLTDIGARIRDDQILYTRAVMRTNGLFPEENARLFQKVLDWYDQAVDLEQAARECGVTVEEFKERVGATATGRLARLVTANYPISRDQWDNPKGGYFAQAMLLIKRIEGLPVQNQIETVIVAYNDVPVMLGETKVGTVHLGERLEVLGRSESKEWIKVRFNNQSVGYIWKGHVEK